MTRCKFAVYYQNKVARFSDDPDARLFGRLQSRFGHLTEMTDKTGLIGQWHHGRETEEFAGHD